MKRIFLCIFMSSLVAIQCLSQVISDRYVPVTICAPLFKNQDQVNLGVSINTSAYHYSVAGQYKNKVVMFNIQHFGNLNPSSTINQLLLRGPTTMTYREIVFGYNFYKYSRKLGLLGGFGRESRLKDNRVFVQIDWGNESRVINAGASLRTNYIKLDGRSIVVLEPAVQGKLIIGNFRIVSQFGYSLMLQQTLENMTRNTTLGVEYVFGNKKDKEPSS